MNEMQKGVFSNVTAYGPSDKDNIFVAEMEIFDKESVKSFKENILNSEMIVFKKGEPSIEETTLQAGRRITQNNTNTGSTMSFRATRNPPAGQAGSAAPGFVVSGHAAQNAGGIGNPFRLNGTDTTIIGRVDDVRVSGGTDAAFCNRGDGITLSNLIQQNSQIILPMTSLAPEGVTVFLAGGTNLTVVRSGVVSNYEEFAVEFMVVQRLRSKLA